MIYLILGAVLVAFGLIAWVGRSRRPLFKGRPVDSAGSKAFGRAFAVVGLGVVVYGLGPATGVRLVAVVIGLIGVTLLLLARRKYPQSAPDNG